MFSSKNQSRQNCKDEEMNMDVTNSYGQVWLVKVPKYIAEKWERAPDNMEVGKLRIAKAPSLKSNVEVSLRLSEAALALKELGENDVPKQHRMNFSTITDQTLGVFTQGNKPSDANFEGKIIQKLEFRPQLNSTYMKLKLESIKKAAEPRRKVQQLERAVINYKPVSDHENNIEYAGKKKAESKKIRDDKQVVLDLLFAAFEKHQYYNTKDLVKITKQPVVYLKEILKEVCNYNVKNPHKNMWELKPQYRHYQNQSDTNKENELNYGVY